MNYEDAMKCESSRRTIYQCLSKCFQLPEESLNEILRELEQQFSVLKSPALPKSTLLRNSFRDCIGIEDLHIDYARLFVGPYSLLAPPYGSVYIERQRRIMGESTMDAIKYYNQAGLEVASTFKEAPDHIVTELEFMYFLIHEELRALELGDTQGFYDKLNLQQEFLTNHLNCWAESFTHEIKSNATTSFYGYLADVVDKFVAEDANYLVEIQTFQQMDA